jgi:hypothetical protein
VALRVNLWEIVVSELAANNMGIAANCLQLLQAFVRAAELQLANSPSRAAEAEQNLRQFIQAMIQDAGIHGWSELHEDTFYGAKLKLCPLFPFC